MKWLITGGCGFIGTALIRVLLSNNPKIQILVLDNLSIGKQSDLEILGEVSKVSVSNLEFASRIGLLVGDIRDESICLKAAQDVDCIVHLAANTGVGPSVEDPRLDLEANVFGVFNVLEACRLNNVEKFIFASSGAPAGVVEPPIHEEIAPHPASPYGASKLAGEGYCSAYFNSFDIKTIALRFGNVYGPGSFHKDSVVAKFLKQALAGEVCEIYGDGEQTRDFIFIEDLVDAIVLASKFNGGGEIFQISAGAEVTLNELVEALKAAVFDATGINMLATFTEVRVGDVKRNYADTSKARDLLGWESRHNLDDGLSKTVQDFV